MINKILEQASTPSTSHPQCEHTSTRSSTLVPAMFLFGNSFTGAFGYGRYQKFEFLLPVTVSVTFQATEVAFKCDHTSNASVQPCFYMTSAQFGSLQSLSVSPGALNVEIDGMWMGTRDARITIIVDNNGCFSTV